jgi:hypothetical protein
MDDDVIGMMTMLLGVCCLGVLASERAARLWPLAISAPAIGGAAYLVRTIPSGPQGSVLMAELSVAAGIMALPVWGALYAQGVRWVRLGPWLAAIALAVGVPLYLGAGAMAAESLPSIPMPPAEWGWPGAMLLGLAYLVRWASQGGSLPIRIEVVHRVPAEILEQVRRVEVHLPAQVRPCDRHDEPTEESSGVRRRPR